jgi:hypothetical protein
MIVAFTKPLFKVNTKTVKKIQFNAIPKGADNAALAAYSLPTVIATNSNETKIVLGSSASTPPNLVPRRSAIHVETEIQTPAIIKERITL